jgi:hypothetical protein
MLLNTDAGTVLPAAFEELAQFAEGIRERTTELGGVERVAGDEPTT